VGITNVH
jgi:hypothetical protein